MDMSMVLCVNGPLDGVVCSEYVNNIEFCYTMTHRRRGKLTIISNRHFLPESPMYAWPRHGTEYDVEYLRWTFNELGFDCEVYEDKTSAEMLGIFLNGTWAGLSSTAI